MLQHSDTVNAVNWMKNLNDVSEAMPHTLEAASHHDLLRGIRLRFGPW